MRNHLIAVAPAILAFGLLACWHPLHQWPLLAICWSVVGISAALLVRAEMTSPD